MGTAGTVELEKAVLPGADPEAEVRHEHSFTQTNLLVNFKFDCKKKKKN